MRRSSKQERLLSPGHPTSTPRPPHRATHRDDHAHSHHYDETIESLDYEPIESQASIEFQENVGPRAKVKNNAMRWLITFWIGAFTGLSAYIISLCVTELADFKFWSVKHLLSIQHDFLAFFVFAGISLGYTLIASSLVSFVEPASSGSGIPDIKAYLNGANIPHILRIKTLLCKFVGVIFAVASGLLIGKEGPMVHTGAIFGAGISQGGSPSLHLGSKQLRSFRNDHDKRDFVSSGAAAGVAAAFGAPVGGVLFVLEEASSFWSQELTWRTLFCSMVSTFTLNFFLSGAHGYFNYAGLVTYKVTPEDGYHVFEIFAFLLVGALGGIIGACFNYFNVWLNKRRRDWFTGKSPIRRVVDASIVILITAVIIYSIPMFFSCVRVPPPSPPDPCIVGDNDDDLRVQFTCPDGFFNPMATIIFTPQEVAVKHLFSRNQGDEYGVITLLVYAISAFFVACLTYGTSVPSGLFIPCILIGSAYGRLFGKLLIYMFPHASIHPGVYALIGASSMLGGVSRMTISLTVILFEVTNDITFLLPIMCTLMMAKWVGDRFTIPLYDAHIEIKGIPFLEEHSAWNTSVESMKQKATDSLSAIFASLPTFESLISPRSSLHDVVIRRFPQLPPNYMRASHVMASPVISCTEIENVGTIVDLMNTTSHNGFPVISEASQVCGLILRSQLHVLLNKKCFMMSPFSEDVSRLEITDFVRPVDHRVYLFRSLQVTEAERAMFIDLRPYMNRCPFEVRASWPLSRVYRLFRTMGLRHLCVIDESRRLLGMITRHDLLERPSDIYARSHLSSESGLL